MYSASSEGWSAGTGPRSARFSRNNDYLERYGVAEPLDPHSGIRFLKEACKYTSDRLSLSKDLITDQQWSASQASVLLIKGVMDLDVANAALKNEGVYPITCKLKDVERPMALATIWIMKVQDSVCGAYDDYIVSFDVHRTREGVVAFDENDFRSARAYAIWYNHFGEDVCDGQFIHSVYSNSPLSIAWGREMQSIPRHPVPVLSSIDILFDETKQCDFLWGKKMVFQVYVKKRFGTKGFLKEAVGLVGRCGAIQMAKRLSRKTLKFDAIMPKQTAEQNSRPREYKATIWKGLNPGSVQLWKWNPCTDNLVLEEVGKATGAEPNNGIPVLKAGKFKPIALCFMDKCSGVIDENSEGPLDQHGPMDSTPYREDNLVEAMNNAIAENDR